MSVDEKIVKINDILIEQYSIKYSTIVVFDGTEYVVKASNVDKKHWDTLRNLQNDFCRPLSLLKSPSFYGPF